MELNKTKVRYILRQYRKQVSTKEIALDIKVVSTQSSTSHQAIKRNRAWADI